MSDGAGGESFSLFSGKFIQALKTLHYESTVGQGRAFAFTGP